MKGLGWPVQGGAVASQSPASWSYCADLPLIWVRWADKPFPAALWGHHSCWWAGAPPQRTRGVMSCCQNSRWGIRGFSSQVSSLLFKGQKTQRLLKKSQQVYCMWVLGWEAAAGPPGKWAYHVRLRSAPHSCFVGVSLNPSALCVDTPLTVVGIILYVLSCTLLFFTVSTLFPWQCKPAPQSLHHTLLYRWSQLTQPVLFW